ncbi:7564_t:CDS:2, partial [Cetraspora pellucida]
SFDKIENVVLDVLADNLRYEKQVVLNRKAEEAAVTELLSVHEELSDNSESSLEEEKRVNIDVIDLINISSISLASPYESFHRFLSFNYIEQYVINSINRHGKDVSNWLELCENKEIEKNKQFASEYDIAVVDSVQLIAASLKDRKPQCIIATSSTTTQDDEVEHIVKKHNNLSLVKFI